jgi:hypothetical protein
MSERDAGRGLQVVENGNDGLDLLSWEILQSDNLDVNRLPGEVDTPFTFFSVEELPQTELLNPMLHWDPYGVRNLLRQFIEVEDAFTMDEYKQVHTNITRALNCHFGVIGESKCLIVNRVADARSFDDMGTRLGASFQFVQRRAWKDFMESYQVTFISSKGRLLEKPIADMYLTCPSVNRFTGRKFLPYWPGHPELANHRTSFNTWPGPGVAPHTIWNKFVRTPREDILREIQPFLDHLKTIIHHGNEESYAYDIKFFASLIQQPWKKLGVCRVIGGERGAGKDVLLQRFRAIVGLGFKEIHSVQALMGSFNGILQDATVVFFNEAFFAKDPSKVGSLQALVTQDSHILNQKYLPQIEQRSHINLVLASNEAHIVPAKGNSRRYVVTECDNRYAGRSNDPEVGAYFRRLRHIDIEQLAFFFYFMVDLDTWDARDIPITEALKEQRQLSLGDLELWWLETLQTGATGVFGREVERDDLRRQYSEYLTVNSPQARTINAREFTVQLRQCCFVLPPGALPRRGAQRTSYVPVPTLVNARKQWIQKHGPTDWHSAAS